MASREFLLSPAALQDLERIRRESAERWGVAHADAYIHSIFEKLTLLAEFPEMSRERQELRCPVRLHPFRAHLIAYRIDGDTVVIARILHRRQNWRAIFEDG